MHRFAVQLVFELFEGVRLLTPYNPSREGCGVAKRSSCNGSVGVCGALGACKKHAKSYNTAKFHSLNDALLAGARGSPYASCYRVLHFRRVFAKICAMHKK